MKRKVKGTQTNYVEVELSGRDVRELVRDYLEEKFDIPPYPVIKDGVLYGEKEEWGGSHSWFTEFKHRRAKPVDASVIEVLHNL